MDAQTVIAAVRAAATVLEAVAKLACLAADVIGDVAKAVDANG